MAIRGGPARRIPGNPLAGVLRASAQQARSTTRRSVAVPGPEGPPGPPGPEGPIGLRGRDGAPGTTTAVATLVSDLTGGIIWVFPGEPLPQPPVVTATAVAVVPTLVTIVGLSGLSVTLRVWQQGEDGLFVPGLGVAVHVTAVPSPAPGSLTSDHQKGR